MVKIKSDSKKATTDWNLLLQTTPLNISISVRREIIEVATNNVATGKEGLGMLWCIALCMIPELLAR